MEFSTLYQELQNSTEMIRALLSGVAPEAACLKPSAQSWSILEVVCHLYDEETEQTQIICRASKQQKVCLRLTQRVVDR